MRKTHSKQESEVENINLTPLIDTVFILLIFFLVTSSFTKESGIDVDRPTAQSAVREEQKMTAKKVYTLFISTIHISQSINIIRVIRI